MPTSDIKKGPLYVDSTNNRVGIGTSSPSDALTVSTSAVNGGVTVSGSTDPQYFLNSSGGNQARFKINDASSMIQTGSWTNIPVGFYTNGTERMRIDSNGNVGIGRVPDANAVLQLNVSTGLNSNISFAENGTNKWLIGNTAGSDSLRFYDFTSAAEAMRIISGNLLVGTTSNIFNSRQTTRFESSGVVVGHTFWNGGGDGQKFTQFINSGGGLIGSITQSSASSTSYNTSSDYRLKENVVADWDATTRLKQLNPVRFNFIADADTTVDGFLAHEVQTVVPEAVTGTHNEVDDDGNPVYQGIDQSKLVPLLVKTIQELEARIAALEAS